MPPARAVTFVPAAPLGLNWNTVQAIQIAIPETFKDPNCRTVHHVSEILNSDDRRSDLNQISSWQHAVERIVNSVVSEHHNSFSKSIKKYAEIVSLFESSHQNVFLLRRTLSAARDQLLSDLCVHCQIKVILHQTLVFRHLADKLSQLERLTQLPKEVRGKIEDGQLTSAVYLAAETKSILGLLEHGTVGGPIIDLLQECASSSESVCSVLLNSLLDILFCRAQPFRRLAREYEKGGNLTPQIWRRFAQNNEIHTELSRSSILCCSRWFDERSMELKTTHVGHRVKNTSTVSDQAFLLKPCFTLQKVKEDIEHIVECLFRLHSADDSRVIDSILGCMRIDIREIVRESILYCCSRKDTIVSVALQYFGTATPVSSQCSETLNEAESTALLSLLTDHILNAFRLVLMNLQYLDSMMVNAVPGVSLSSCFTCALREMEASFQTAIEGIIRTGHVDLDENHSVSATQKRDAWWQRDTFANTDEDNVTFYVSRCELLTFEFQCPPDKRGLADTSLLSIRSKATDFNEHQAQDINSEENGSEYDSLLAAARHLRTVLRVTSIAQTWDKVSTEIKLLLEDLRGTAH